MDRHLLMRNLLKAERYVAQGENHVAARRRRLRELERDGHSTDHARDLLDIFEQTLATRVADRDRLVSELRLADQDSPELRASDRPAARAGSRGLRRRAGEGGAQSAGAKDAAREGTRLAVDR